MRGKTFLFAVALTTLPAAANATDATVTGDIESTTQTTPKEKVDFATSSLQEMASADKSVKKMLDQATKEGESAGERIKCLNNKLASIRALAQVADAANTQMNAELAAGNSGQADFQFRKIAVSITKVRQFVAEAEACNGQTGQTGGTENVSVTGDLSSDDLAEIFPETEDIVPAPDISPFE